MSLRLIKRAVQSAECLDLCPARCCRRAVGVQRPAAVVPSQALVILAGPRLRLWACGTRRPRRQDGCDRLSTQHRSGHLQHHALLRGVLRHHSAQELCLAAEAVLHLSSADASCSADADAERSGCCGEDAAPAAAGQPLCNRPQTRPPCSPAARAGKDGLAVLLSLQLRFGRCCGCARARSACPFRLPLARSPRPQARPPQRLGAHPQHRCSRPPARLHRRRVRQRWPHADAATAAAASARARATSRRFEIDTCPASPGATRWAAGTMRHARCSWRRRGVGARASRVLLASADRRIAIKTLERSDGGASLLRLARPRRSALSRVRPPPQACLETAAARARAALQLNAAAHGAPPQARATGEAPTAP